MIAAKMPLLQIFLPIVALITFAIPSYVLKLKHPKLPSPPIITQCNDGRCKTSDNLIYIINCKRC